MREVAPIDISHKDKAQVLTALYNHARPRGWGILEFDPMPMEVSHARLLLEKQDHFEYVYGRVLKVDLSGDCVNPYLYDKANGEGSAQRAIDTVPDL